VHKSNFVIYRM